ncbi:SpoVA/SpoVAEb family sporulation membrane protein [Ruminococcus sp.]|uniref:SpoVA/SpoVAEb family sporulation membrane protein n=1 Tax=Ruminococcus sp. TaxID=41978 RepID=UPI0025D3E980|nr:SpoVA/SpoVAEb family sporulation membrane protein [Ruminococcus sp.]MCR4638227.1 SpoVA/SpoVAEb family sporulation membrane protein [Ruminococcus sp.]
MKMTPELYGDMTRQASPKSNYKVNIAAAFLVGGAICAIGQIILTILKEYGLSTTEAGTWTSIILVGISAVCTGFGWYSKLAKHAGAGTLVPITGFSNAISSAAVEARSEGFVLGVGAKIFTIAGPVILFGCSAAVVYGLIYYFIT